MRYTASCGQHCVIAACATILLMYNLFILFILLAQRRVEEKRRVHFLEQVVTITPPELDPDSSDSEEDLREEGDSVQELEHEEEQAGIEEVAPARRSALSAWILSLKKMNSQRKQRK